MLQSGLRRQHADACTRRIACVPAHLMDKIDTLITGITLGYQRESVSLFRKYQVRFLERYGPELHGNVIELGGEKKYNHARFVPKAASYVCTNIARDYDEYLDVTAMTLPDNSQDAYLCISVLEHVPDIHQALNEIHRTLKIGGRLLLTVPFAFPVHDEADFWRMSRSAYEKHFERYEIRAFVHLGGMISTILDVLQRPRGVRTGRYRVYKWLGVFLAATLGRFDTLDSFPLGFGIYAVKRA
jgi:SAM-dependent methyltransferase